MAVVAAGMLVLLFSLPLRATLKEKTAKAQCAANLRQFAVGLHLYASDNSQRLPSAYEQTGSPYIIEPPIFSSLQRYGVAVDAMFCPLNRLEVLPSIDPLNGSLTIGYATTFAGSRLGPTNRNIRIIPEKIVFEGGVHPPPSAAERVLLADVVLSKDPAAPSFDYYLTTTGTGPAYVKSTVHESGSNTFAANVAMLDGHVVSRPVAGMTPRTESSIYFWW